MNEERMQQLKDYYLSQNKPEKIAMFEFFSHVKHEIRTGIRERENQRTDNQTKVV